MNEATHRESLRVAGLLCCVVFAAYGNALLWGGFQFDDYNVIVDNLRVHSWQAWWDDLAHGIRPLLKFTYTLNWTSGWGVRGFLLTNILIHFGNTLLVWLLARRLIAHHPPLQPKADAIALFTALLFALHPIHTEAIIYVCGRSTALMTMFYLAGLLAYAAGRTQNNRLCLHVLTPLCFLIAIGIKETAVTFPLALLAWEVCCGGTWQAALRRQWSSWTLLAAGAIFFFANAGYLAQMERSAGLNSLYGNLATQLLATAYLLRQWFAPLWLNIDPDLPLLHGFAGNSLPLLSLGTVVLVIIFSYRRRPWLGFAVVWVVIELIPLHLFLPRLDVANDRQMYLVSWPLAFMLAAEMSLRLKEKTFIPLAAILLALAGGLTLSRNLDYRSEVALWQATAQQSPNKARVRNNLGYAYWLAGRNDEARAEYRRALQIDPEYIRARRNLLRLEAGAAP